MHGDDTPMPIHVRAEPGEYADACLLPGDPLRAKYVAETFLEDVQQRDYNDTHRDVAPLRQAEDAVLVDTTECDLEESYQLLLNTIRERI